MARDFGDLVSWNSHAATDSKSIVITHGHGDQFDHSAAIPGRFEGEVLQVEDHPLGWIEVGGADGTLATVSHVVELDTACTGDGSTRNIHTWLWHWTSASRSTWLATYGDRGGGSIRQVSESAELGVLLRGWRERVTPGDVGLAVDPGRRVPGLRRQEVAKLAGVSPDYLVQLEQGRATAPSAQVLLAMARTLRLSNFERDHLLRLAGYGPPVEHDAAPSADLQRLVRQLGVVPAAMYDVCWNPITWNRLWAAVNGDPLGRPVRERNMMWRFMVGLPTRVRRSAADVHDVQRALVGDLRATLGQHGHDDRCSEFVAGLSAHSDNFRDLWNMQHVDAYRHDTKVIDQPQVGTLHVDCDVLVGSDGQRLVMYTALPRSVTADRLQQLFEASEDPKAPSELSA